MGPLKRLGAAVAGLAVAFVIVMFITAMGPSPGLHEGEGEVRFERFAFTEEETAFTDGSQVTLVNAGAVAATFVVTDPDDETVRFPVGPGQQANVTVTTEGRYTVTTLEWPWAVQEWDIRSANPFQRFVEDLF